MIEEGVTKFVVEHEQRALEQRRYGALACKLVAWRELMALTGLVGQEASRYGGAGYGNVSGRAGAPSAPRGARSFLITGTGTSGSPCIALEQLCVVQRYDPRRNSLASCGEIRPSSESLTHGAIYDLSPHIRFVLHAHAPVIWQRARQLRLAITDSSVSYGTPEMAREVQRLYSASAFSEQQILAMGGHEDGVVVFGRSAEEAGGVMLATLARAYELQCSEQGIGLCRI